MVRRAAALLEAYVGKSSLVALRRRPRGNAEDDGERALSRQEALEVLGLEAGADEAAIRAAHKRLLGLVHPDHSGSAWLAKQVQQARDTLLAPSREWLSSAGESVRAEEPGSEALGALILIAGSAPLQWRVSLCTLFRTAGLRPAHAHEAGGTPAVREDHSTIGVAHQQGGPSRMKPHLERGPSVRNSCFRADAVSTPRPEESALR